jgi:hypothetical protein
VQESPHGATKIMDYSHYVTGIGNTVLPLTVKGTDLATGEGRKKVCPDLAIADVHNAECAHSNPVNAICGCAESA